MQEEWRSLNNEDISSYPCNIHTISSGLSPKNPCTFPKFLLFIVSIFVFSLRNAASHGYDRNFSPRNIDVRLFGYIFRCIEEDRKKKVVTFIEDVSLTSADMARIGKELARRHGRGIQRKIGYSMTEALPALREPRQRNMLRLNLSRG
jgi:hypothetical protein